MSKKRKGLLDWLRTLPTKPVARSITEEQINEVLEKAWAAEPVGEEVKAIVTAPVVLMRKDRKTFKVARVWCQMDSKGELTFAKCIELDWLFDSDLRREILWFKLTKKIETPPNVKAHAVYLEF